MIVIKIMEQAYDIHKTGQSVIKSIEKVEKSGIDEINKKNILKFHEQLIAESISPGRQAKYLYTLNKLAGWLNKPFGKADKTDIVKLVMKIEQTEMSVWTKHDFKALLKRFYKWLEGDGLRCPEKISWLTTTVKNKKFLLPEQILTEDEVKHMINAANTNRDRALISVLYESGCRIGELLSLKIKHITFDKLGCVLIVSGKTGMRRVRIMASEIEFRNYLNVHPEPKNPESYVWIADKIITAPMSYARVFSLLKDAAKKAGITKPINPHSFRKARATHMAGKLTEFQLKQYFGWTPGSDVAGTYVRLKGEDLDNALLEMNGRMPIEKQKKGEFSVLSCPRCREENKPTSTYCVKCGFVLDEELSLAVEKERGKAANVLDAIATDPEYSKKFESLVNEFLKKRIVRV